MVPGFIGFRVVDRRAGCRELLYTFALWLRIVPPKNLFFCLGFAPKGAVFCFGGGVEIYKPNNP